MLYSIASLRRACVGKRAICDALAAEGVSPKPDKTVIVVMINLTIKAAVLPRPARAKIAEELEVARMLDVAELKAVRFYAQGPEVWLAELEVAFETV